MELVSGEQIGIDASTQAMKILFKDKRNIQNASIFLSASTIALIHPAPITALLCLGSILNLTQIIRIFKERKDELYTLTSESYRDTETYRDCKKEYDEAVKEIAKLIHKLGLKSSKEVCVFIGLLIKNGYLSENGKNNYHKHKYEYEHEIPELTGAKVFTGNCVCRHYSSLTTDILTELGYEACNIAVRICHNKNSLTALRRKRKNNHMVVGIYETGEKYIYDPTNDSFGAEDQSLPETTKEKHRIAKVIKPNYLAHYLIRKPNIIINFNKEDTIYKVHRSQLATISTFELDIIKKKIEKLMSERDNELKEFATNNQERFKRIALLSQELMPASDDPIDNWQLRK